MEARIKLESELCEALGSLCRKEIAAILQKYKVSFATEESLENPEKKVQQFLYAKRVEGLSPKTLEGYRWILIPFIRFVEKDAADIEITEVRRYLAYQFEEKKLKESSIQTHINTLRSFFGWLHREELIDRNPMLKIKSLKIDKKFSQSCLGGVS